MAADRKTIPSVDVGGIAGGQKFLSHHIFFKFVTDDEGLYGSEDAAMKAAGHELKGSRAFLRCGVSLLRTPLMAVLDFAGCRVVACSLLPVSSSTLMYGSADAGRTVHRDPRIAALMDEAGAALNLKRHLVGPAAAPVPIVGPCDIEVHTGRDGRVYVRAPERGRVFCGGCQGSPPTALFPRFGTGS